MISPTAKIYPHVKLGKNVCIEDFCIIGIPPHGQSEEKFETIIGDNAVIRAFTVIYAGNRIGTNFQTGNKANIRELNEIGNNVSVGTLAVVEHHSRIEDKARIHSQAFVPEYSWLQEGSWVGPNCVLTNAKYPISPGEKSRLKGPVLGRYCKIGANSTLLPGVSIGANSLVGAGSVVTQDIPPNEVHVGNPARFLKSIHKISHYQEPIHD